MRCDNYVTASRYGATPKAKLGGGSLLLLFAVRAARQLAMIHLPTAAGASHPTTYPLDHSASAQEVSGEVAPGRRQLFGWRWRGEVGHRAQDGRQR